MDRELVVACNVFSMLKGLQPVANYDIAKFSNNCTFSNDTAEDFNSKTNKFDYTSFYNEISKYSQ